MKIQVIVRMQWKYGIFIFMLLAGIGTVTAVENTSPAFDTTVSASSSVSNVQAMAYESKLSSSLIGKDGSSPAQVHYSVSISGVNGSAYGGAVGSARTDFRVSSLEGRDSLMNASSEREWRDSTEVTGIIVNFRKNFDYLSGLRL